LFIDIKIFKNEIHVEKNYINCSNHVRINKQDLQDLLSVAK